jgi:hypothetical protein
VQNRRLHRHTVGGTGDDARARSVEHVVGDRDVAPHRQAVHEMTVGLRGAEPLLGDAPLREAAAQVRLPSPRGAAWSTAAGGTARGRARG